MGVFSSSRSLAQRERHALVDLCASLGPDAPTLDEGWTTRDLVTHLRIRETRPLGALGIFVPAFSRFTIRSEKSLASWEYSRLLNVVKAGPPWWSVFWPIDRLANTAEMFVHHEDVRRANPGGRIERELDLQDRLELWKVSSRLLGIVLKKSPVPLVMIPTDGAQRVVCAPRRPDDPVEITGRVTELVLWGYGRGLVDVSLGGNKNAKDIVSSLDRSV